jgi:hypothetical protein
MHIVGELKLDFRSYRRLALSAFGRKYWIMQVLAGLAAVLTVARLALDGFSTSRLALLVGCVVGMVIMEVAVLIGWRRMGKLTAQPWRYVVTDSEVGIHTPYTDFTTRWDGVAGVRTRRHIWAIRLGNKAVVSIPRAAFAPGDVAHIDALVAAVGAKSR